MKLTRCPVCHSDIHLDQLLEDDAGRELLALIVGLKGDNARALVSYIALFRPDKSNLSNSRALKLMQEVLELYAPSPLLSHALQETVNAVHKKRRDSRNVAALVNHNYLKQVYETARPQFAVVRNEQGKVFYQDELSQAKQEADKKAEAVQYIERYAVMGQLDMVKHTQEYVIWLEWKKEKGEL